MKAFFWLILFSVTAHAANFFVTPNGSGSANGKDWSNAWGVAKLNSSQSSLAPGDKVYLGGGKYSSAVKTTKNGSAGNPISYLRAVASDSVCTGAAGWTAALDSAVDFGNKMTELESSFIIFSGRVPGGFVYSAPAGGDMLRAGSTKAVQDIEIAYFDGTGSYGKSTSSASYGMNICPYEFTRENLLIHHCKLLGFCEAFRSNMWKNATIEYCVISDTPPDDFDHEDFIYNYPGENVTIRYSIWANSPNDGHFYEFGGAKNFKFYGNLVYGASASQITFKQGSSYGPVYIYNNLFHGPSSSGSASWITGNGKVDGEVKNNIFWNTANGLGNGGGSIKSTNNAYNYTTLNGYGWPSNETGSFTFTGDPFVKMPDKSNPTSPGPIVSPFGTGGDFRLTDSADAKFDTGTVLASEFARDIDGNTRGAGGKWTIGPFQRGGTGGGPTPTPGPTATPAPTPNPTATPAPTPTPAPEAKFKPGDTVTPTAVVNVRSEPSGTILGTHKPGDTGTIGQGPEHAPLKQEVAWYEITWATSPLSGWSGDDDLAKAAGPAPTPTPAPSPTATPSPNPSPSPGSTFDDWTKELNAAQSDWIVRHPPYPD